MIYALILAAGKSTRMGRPKALLDINGITFLQHAIQNCQAAGIQAITIVLGSHAQEIQNAHDPAAVTVLHNKNYERGQSSSVQCGVRSMSDDTQAFLLYPVDFAYAQSNDIKKIIQKYQQNPRAKLYTPTYENQKGHPVLLHADLRNEILALPPQEGINNITRKYHAQTVRVPVNNPNIARDIDTPADYDHLLKHNAR